MMNWEDLTTEGMDFLNQWFNEFPDLYTAYMTKETFRDIYITAKDRTEADSMFDEWLKTVPPYPAFEPVRKTMTKRREHILNYWNAPYTNAYTESVNNLIKKIEKAGRGYKFDTLRERCMLEINTEKPGNTDYVLLKDSLMLYFECFDRTKHIESTAARLRAYAEAIQKLVH